MNWLEEQQELTQKIEALSLNSDEWARGITQSLLTHWTGASLTAPMLNAGDAPEFIKAIDRYVARLSPEEVTAGKRLFLDYKEARRFCLDFGEWLTDQISTDCPIETLVANHKEGAWITAAQLTGKVPSALRERVARAQAIGERWDEKASKVNNSLCISATYRDEEGKFHMSFEFLPSPLPKPWELRITNAISILSGEK